MLFHIGRMESVALKQYSLIALNPVIVDKCGHRGLGCDFHFYLL